jgi:hypothetical protein
MAMDGLVTRPALARVIEGMVDSGLLQAPVELDDILKDAASIDACQQLVGRGVLDRHKMERWRAAKGVVAAGT